MCLRSSSCRARGLCKPHQQGGWLQFTGKGAPGVQNETYGPRHGGLWYFYLCSWVTSLACPASLDRLPCGDVT